jgi:hypothetical protein
METVNDRSPSPAGRGMAVQVVYELAGYLIMVRTLSKRTIQSVPAYNPFNVITQMYRWVCCKVA